ncbi:uncharacterized protein LOC142177250 [Nicotiana tabacum]|uniref:Uncharacterized protein LOC142177250 n=1 Tax=Nicotiana tabacum TaxID=4097 RepID=A0AC58TX83_TOBAC
MDNVLIWNVRSINTQNAFHGLIKLHRKYNFYMISLMEPWQDINKLEVYRKKLGLRTALDNLNVKIWAFIDEDIELIIMLVYAKYDVIQRIELWDSLYHFASGMELPWFVGDNFNVILSKEEKYGGLPVYLREVENFAHCITHVKGKRKKLQVSRILDNNCNWFEDQGDMAKEAIEFFKAQFTEDKVPTDFDIIKHIPNVITEELNAKLWAEPTMEEVKNVVFGINRESPSGPNRFTGQFYHTCWEIICETFLNIVKAGFVKGRSIVENILLTQEIIADIGMRGKPSNIIIKLYMKKAYDRVSWIFLTKVLRRMGFGEVFIDMISSHYRAIQLIMNVLEDYEADSEQQVNKEKSSFYMHENAPPEEANTMHLITTFQRYPFPFTFLRCTIFYSRRKEFYKGITFKVQQRLHSWNDRLLSIGGRVVLIAHVLESIPIHLLSVVNPPKYVINEMHKMFARYFGAILQMEGLNIGHHGLHYACLKWKEVLDLDHFMMCLRLCPDHWCDKTIVHVGDMVIDGNWKEEVLREILPDEIAYHIMEKIAPPNCREVKDKPFWQLESKGYFSVKTV